VPRSRDRMMSLAIIDLRHHLGQQVFLPAIFGFEPTEPWMYRWRILSAGLMMWRAQGKDFAMRSRLCPAVYVMDGYVRVDNAILAAGDAAVGGHC